ncbi:unnamed protein product, partial [Amoebophrya sp. A25]|eukprot:GSA25T00016078001.1
MVLADDTVAIRHFSRDACELAVTSRTQLGRLRDAAVEVMFEDNLALLRAAIEAD